MPAPSAPKRSAIDSRPLAWVLLICALVAATGCSSHFPASESDLERSERDFDAAELRGALERIGLWHETHATGVTAELAAGIPDTEIRDTLARLPLSPTREVELLWNWRNGEESVHPLIWYHDFLSAEESAREYKRLRRNPLIGWDPDYLPIFEFQGEWFAVYCGKEGRNAGPVIHLFVEEEPRLVATNLTTFLSTMAEAFDSGAFAWDAKAEGIVDDVVAVEAIHRRRNPGREFPYALP